MTWPPSEEPDRTAPAYGPPPHQAVDAQQYPPPYAQPYGQQPGYPPGAYGQQPGYGYPPHPGGYLAPVNGLGIAGFVCGLVGVLGFWAPFFGGILGILGIVFSAYGMAHGRRHRAGSGLAIAGLVLGIVAVLLGLLVTIAFVTGNYN